MICLRHTQHMVRFTLNIPDELMAALRERHAETYPSHRLAFSPWLCRIWREWLETGEPIER